MCLILLWSTITLKAELQYKFWDKHSYAAVPKSINIKQKKKKAGKQVKKEVKFEHRDD